MQTLHGQDALIADGKAGLAGGFGKARLHFVVISDGGTRHVESN
ncbi:hypothetical protein [Salmonirosea aquatica]